MRLAEKPDGIRPATLAVFHLRQVPAGRFPHVLHLGGGRF